MGIKKEPLIILTGPTAVGKSSLSIRLAKEINGEIISADSMQVYKHMNIGTAKITEEEMCDIKHYLIDILQPEDEFNVYKFRELAINAVNEIRNKGKIPIVVGGTGFYIQALLYNIEFEEENENSEYREQLEEEAKKCGNHALFEKLKKVDPASAEVIHENNIKRVIRALEFFEQNNYPISEHNKIQHTKESQFNSCYFVLTDNRQKIYENINFRVDEMIKNGLLNEILFLKERGLNNSFVSMQGIGYKELIDDVSNARNYSIPNASIELIKQNTRHFAKRQLTWFRREKEVIWLDKESLINNDMLISEIKIHLKDKGIFEVNENDRRVL